MAENIINKGFALRGGVRDSNNATFRLCDLKSNLIFLWRGMTSLKKALAFTLAETLVVMGIIGVVSALVLPNLNSSTGEKEKVAKVKKIYQNLNDAFGRATAVYGPINEWFVNIDSSNFEEIQERLSGRLTEFLKVSKDCGVSKSNAFSTACFKITSYKTLLGFSASYGSYIQFNPGSLILADGTSLLFYVIDTECNENISKSGDCGDVIVDIDGSKKGPNVVGKDTFQFIITKQGVEPLGTLGQNLTEDNLKTGCFETGRSCAGWVIENDNMDYLKADKGTCKNGTVLNYTTNTSCK